MNKYLKVAPPVPDARPGPPPPLSVGHNTRENLINY